MTAAASRWLVADAITGFCGLKEIVEELGKEARPDAVLICLLLFDVRVLNHSFRGHVGIRTVAFQHALSVFTSFDPISPLA